MAFHHAFPRSYAGRSRTGEAAGRSPCPCVPQGDADAMAWLRSLHGSPQTSYIYACVWMPPTYVSGVIISIPPVKPCRRRRHSTLGCGLTGSCSSTFQCYSLGDHLGVTASPQSPFPAGYVTLSVDNRSPPLGLMSPHSRGQGFSPFLLSPCIPVICTPDHPGRGAL